MAGSRVDLLQDGIPFRSLTQLLVFQVGCKDLLDFFVYRRIQRHNLIAGSKITFPFSKTNYSFESNRLTLITPSTLSSLFTSCSRWRVSFTYNIISPSKIPVSDRKSTRLNSIT